MSFKDLETRPLHDFVIQQKDPNAVWIFMHIPKTAGSSFSEAMSQDVYPYKNIDVDYSDYTKTHNEKMSDAVDNFISENEYIKYKSASGHIPFDLFERISKKIPNSKVFTFLRDPVSRVISDYRYQRTPAHPPFEKFINLYPTIESYVESKESQNKISLFISGLESGMSLENTIERIDEKFSFVGLLEMYPMCYNIIFNLIGLPGKLPRLHSRKTEETSQNRVEVNEKLINKIIENNLSDHMLYEHVRKRLINHRDIWSNYLTEGFPSEWK